MRDAAIVRVKWGWTEEDNVRLREFVAQDVSIVRAAASLNRNIKSVRLQARKLGAPFPPMRVFRQKLAEAQLNSKHS